MISRIEGELLAVHGGSAELRCSAMVYEVLIPACDQPQLEPLVGSPITFHTLHFLEAQGQGTSFVPRLIGFTTAEDRAFFELLTGVKGIGPRKALRSLQRPMRDVAGAIAARDVAALKALPEIGQKTAETIVLELRDKVGRFVDPEVAEPTPSSGGGDARLAEDAVTVLHMLGESRTVARQLVDRALAADPELVAADDVVTAALRLKQLVS